jgi:hypothetical protein
MNVINGPKGYVVIIEGVPHTVDKTTKLCDCNGGCLAPSYVEQYFIARRGHLCPICASETKPHRFMANANICVSDPTHYWIVRAEQNRILWKLNEQSKTSHEAGIDPGRKIQPGLPPMPEASQSTS